MGKNLTLYLIRHGQTNRNLNHDLVGQSPTEPLTKVGRQQAKLLGGKLKEQKIIFDRIYSSPYTRALDTFYFADEKFNSELEPIIDERLKEINQGDAINKSRKEIMTPEIIAEMDSLKGNFKFKNGESLNEVEARAIDCLNNDILTHSNDGDIVAIFTHGMTIKSIIRSIMNIDESFTWRIDIDNTSTTKFTLKDGRWFCNYINNTDHLK